MIFDNITNHMKLWCANKSKVYLKAYEESGGIALYVGCLYLYNIEFNLSILTDGLSYGFTGGYYSSTEELKNMIINSVDVHYEPAVMNPRNDSEKYVIAEIKKEFLGYLEEILEKDEYGNLPLVDIPYKRVIIGPEYEAFRYSFRRIWEYENTSYWYPLMGNEPKGITDKFFIMSDYMKPYMKRLEEIIGLPQKHVYSYGETIFRPDHCLETSYIDEYGGSEMMYTDSDFSWVIYFSHENTVAFAGSIVPEVKELLADEEKHWDNFE